MTMKHEHKIPVIAVQGPTASGKSATALAICKHFGGELISCDSMQIYRRMDIGTAKPSKEEMAEIPHHLIDILDPNEDFSAASFAVVAQNAINDVNLRGKLPVLCGGTGLYLDSVLKGVDFGELEPAPEYRAELARFAEENGNIALHERLAAIDPEAALAIHPNNVKRVIRALEICKTSGMTKTEWDKQAMRRESPYAATLLALDYRDRETLYTRIDTRVDMMIQTGLIEEAHALFADGLLTPQSTAGGAIGYKELLGYFEGRMTLTEAADAVKLATRHYAKRQLTWLRKNTAIHWLYPDDYPSKEALFEAAFAVIEQKYT